LNLIGNQPTSRIRCSVFLNFKVITSSMAQQVRACVPERRPCWRRINILYSRFKKQVFQQKFRPKDA